MYFYLCVFFGEIYIYFFCLFSDWVVYFLILSYMSCLYILEINPSSVASFANIFSHSECCLSIFVYFCVWYEKELKSLLMKV